MLSAVVVVQIWNDEMMPGEVRYKDSTITICMIDIELQFLVNLFLWCLVTSQYCWQEGLVHINMILVSGLTCIPPASFQIFSLCTLIKTYLQCPPTLSQRISSVLVIHSVRLHQTTWLQVHLSWNYDKWIREHKNVGLISKIPMGYVCTIRTWDGNVVGRTGCPLRFPTNGLPTLLFL